MAEINKGSMSHAIIQSFDEATESLKTTITNAEVNINVSAFTDSIAIADESGNKATTTTVGPKTALDVNVVDVTLDASNDSVSIKAVDEISIFDEWSDTVMYLVNQMPSLPKIEDGANLMAIIGNYSVLNKTCGSFIGGPTIAQNKGNFKGGRFRNRFTTLPKFNATPNGYNPLYALVMGQTAGGLATYTILEGDLATVNSNLAGGLNAESSMTSILNLTNADLALIVNLLASLSGSLSLTDAQLAGVLSAQADLTANGTMNPATLGAILDAVAILDAAITESIMIQAKASMSAEITPYTELSPQSLATALLNSLLADFNEAGSVGEALNSIGAASNPWNADLASNNTAGTFGERIQKLLTVAKFMGLK